MIGDCGGLLEMVFVLDSLEMAFLEALLDSTHSTEGIPDSQRDSTYNKEGIQ